MDALTDTLNTLRCGRSGLRLPRLTLGLWQGFGGDDTEENPAERIRTAFDLGICSFDPADNCGPPPGSAEALFPAF